MKGTNWRRAFGKSGKETKVKLITKIPKWWVEGTKKIKNSSNKSKRWKKNQNSWHNFWQVTYQKEKEKENRFEKLNRWKTNNGRTFEKQKHAENFWTCGKILQNDNTTFTKTKDFNKNIFQMVKAKMFFKNNQK